MKKSRNYNIDLIRLLALFCVVAVHFFLNSGYYDTIMHGKKMFVMTIFRSLFMVCVPLFITLTGFLMCEKKLSMKYYKRLISVIFTYFLCSMVYSLFFKYYINNPMNVFIFFKNVFSYKGTPYGWYIEMYIGLFLVIPFLNMIVDNLDSKCFFQVLLLTLIVMVSLPGMINIYNLKSLDWWSFPAGSNEYYKIIPSWWVQIYPLLYYFLGAYFRKYNIKYDSKKILLFLGIVILINGSFNFYRSYNSTFVSDTWNDYYSLFTFIQTALVFSLFLNLKISINSNRVKFVLEKLSSASFGAYLISCIFDNIFYCFLIKHVSNVSDRFIYAPIIVLLVYICSLLLALVIDYVQTLIMCFFKKKFHC